MINSYNWNEKAKQDRLESEALDRASKKLLESPELRQELLEKLGFKNGKWEESEAEDPPSQGVRTTSCEWVDKSKKFFLDSDNDGHYYLIPADRREDWENWIDEGDQNELPDYAVGIDGPSSIEFFLSYDS